MAYQAWCQPDLSWYDSDKKLEACFCMTWLRLPIRYVLEIKMIDFIKLSMIWNGRQYLISLIWYEALLYTQKTIKAWKWIDRMSCVLGKNALRYLSLSYPRKGWRGGLLWVWHWLWNCTLLLSQIIFSTWCYTVIPTNPSFGVTMTKIVRHVFPWHGSNLKYLVHALSMGQVWMRFLLVNQNLMIVVIALKKLKVLGKTFHSFKTYHDKRFNTSPVSL